MQSAVLEFYWSDDRMASFIKDTARILAPRVGASFTKESKGGTSSMNSSHARTRVNYQLKTQKKLYLVMQADYDSSYGVDQDFSSRPLFDLTGRIAMLTVDLDKVDNGGRALPCVHFLHRHTPEKTRHWIMQSFKDSEIYKGFCKHWNVSFPFFTFT
ncbi:unnamed protein product [Amoebophrya sp. A25]|nr:unnamed protein product [Amoebophrya sp. A25]|eukprot:GSA25T00002541001.1